MKQKFIDFYKDIAIRTAQLSYCERKQVGAIIVRGDSIISYGYNGMPPGMPNICELSNGTTDPLVIHAEENAFRKVDEQYGEGLLTGASIFITLSPCINCANLIISRNIENVYYIEQYRDSSGIELLRNSGVNVYNI